jgi:hypothetical protein
MRSVCHFAGWDAEKNGRRRRKAMRKLILDEVVENGMCWMRSQAQNSKKSMNPGLDVPLYLRNDQEIKRFDGLMPFLTCFWCSHSACLCFICLHSLCFVLSIQITCSSWVSFSRNTRKHFWHPRKCLEKILFPKSTWANFSNFAIYIVEGFPGKKFAPLVAF